MRLFIALLVLSISLPAFAQPVPPPPPPAATITVQGEGKSAAPPDYAALSADLVTAGATLEAATKDHRARADRAAAALKSLEADGLKVESSTFQLDRVTPPVTPGQKPPAPEFRAVTSFTLRTKRLDTIDDTVTKLASTGLFEIRGLRFALDDDSKALDAARRNAVLDARHRAEIYAEAAGMKVGDILDISDGDRTQIPVRQVSYARADMRITPPEKLDVQAAVTITWRLDK